MQHILGRKTLILFLIIISLGSSAQVNMHENDMKHRLNFGFSVATNVGDFRVKHSSNFITNDTVLVAESSNGAGFNVGIIVDYTINRYWSIRTVPAASFALRKLHYNVCEFNGLVCEEEQVENGIESIYTTIPLLFKYSSERFGNNRVYLLTGLQYAYDWASNAEARLADDIVKIKKHDLSFEYGAGLDIYLQLAKISLEIKGSYGMINLLVPDKELDYAKVFDRLSSRGITFSLLIGG